MDPPRPGQRVMLQQQREGGPGHAAMPITAGQPQPPEPTHRVPEPLQRRKVARDPEVTVVPVQLLTQCLVLVRDGPMSVPPTPRSDLLERAPKAVRHGLPLHHPVATP